MASLLAVVSASAQTVAAADSAALLGITQRLMDAVTTGDSAVWSPHLAARWFLTDEEGRHVTRQEFLGDLRGLPKGQSGRLEVAGSHVVGGPGAMVVSYDIDEWHDFYGQELKTRFHATDSWVRESGQWKMIASQVTALPTAIGGRPVGRAVQERYTGKYSLTPEIELTITAGASGLEMKRGQRPAERLYALDDRIFVRHAVRGFWVFESDGSGRVVELVNWRDNNAVRWRRAR